MFSDDMKKEPLYVSAALSYEGLDSALFGRYDYLWTFFCPYFFLANLPGLPPLA